MEFLTVQFDIQEPVIFLGLIGNGTVHEIIAGGIINTEKLLCGKEVCSCECHNLCICQHNFRNPILKLLILIMPYDDAALVEFRQRRGKAPIQILKYDIHVDAYHF